MGELYTRIKEQRNKKYGALYQSLEKRKIGLDTLETDLASASDLVNRVYSGWHSADDMKSSRQTVSAMRDRLTAYRGYANDNRNGQDLTEFNTGMDKLIGAYDAALADWDALAAEYARYTDADSYGVAKKNSERYNKYKGLDFDGVQKAIKENPDDAEFLSRYGLNVGYADKKDIEKEIGVVDYYIANSEGAEQKAWKDYRNRLYETTTNQNALFKGSEAFADGYQPGDVLDTVGATAADVVVRGSKGIASALEGLGDFATYGVAGLAGLVGADGVSQYLKDLAKQDMTGDLYRPYYSTAVHRDSVLGGLGTAVAEGVGQMGFNLATAMMGSGAGLGKVGTELVSKGALFSSAAGNSMSEAYNNGATDGEALAYGLLSGTVETGSEMMFGGLGKAVNSIGLNRGIAGFDDILAKKIGGKINNFVLRNAAEMGIKATGEGVEEVVAGLGSAVAKKLTYMSDEDLGKLVKDEELLNQFLVGTLSSAVTQTPSLVQSYKYGTDYVTNRTAAEEFVISSDYEARLAEAEKDGKKLSNREKDKLYRQVEEDLTAEQKKLYESVKRNAPNAVGRVASMDVSDTVDNATGASIKVQGIRTDESGNTVLKTSAGEKAIDSVTLNRRDAELVAMAEGMEPSQADLFVSMYSGQDTTTYKDSFDMAYAYGKNAYGVETAIKRRGVLTEAQALKVYKLGISERTSSQQKQIDAITEKHFAEGGKTVEGKFDDTGVDYTKLNSRQKAAASFAKMFSKATGVNVVLFESKADENGVRKAENGRYESGTNTIYMDVYAGFMESAGVVEDAMIPTLSHELTHWMKEKAPDAYANLSDIVMDTLSQHHKAAPEVLVAAEKKRHKDNGRDVSDEYAQDELIARACEDMLSGNKTAAEIIEKMDAETAKTFSEKFKEVVAKIRAWLKDLLKVYKSNSEEAKILRQYDSKLAELQKAWDEAFAKAMKANQALQNSKAEDAGVAESRRKYSDRNLFLTSDDIPGYLKAGSRRNIKRIKRYEAGEKIIISNEAELRDFVSKSISGEITGKTVAYGIVSKKLADAVYKESSGKVDVRGYYLELVADDINHSFKEHQEAKKADNLPLSEEDFVTAILRVNSSKLVNVEYHADNSRAIKLCLEGADGNTMLIEVVSVSAGSIKLKTVWKETKRNSANTAGNRNSNPNSRLGSARDASVSKDSIPQNAENIKENVQFSERNAAENVKTVEEYFGRTFNVNEAGYILANGHLLDMSGKHEGAPGGYRTVDHRDITDALGGDYGGDDYSGAMIQFMREGNIRISPEGGGINLSVMPKASQMEVLSRYVSKFRGEVVLDIDDLNGNTIVSVEYPKFTHANTVIKDITDYFEKGKIPESFNVAYSDRDSEGNGLTPEQVEFFKESKVRDEKGNLLVMYHGTPNAGFTVFRSGTYFTENKEYADVYQNQGASSLGYKKTADNPDTYAVYLNIKKPFDTRNKAERDIFYNEYYRKYGMGTDLMESGLPDWMDGMDLQEFLEENGYDYDGLILDEGGVGGYGDEVKSRGLSYVTFDASQVKDITNQNPTENEDIRYSDRDSEGNGLTKEQIEYFRESKLRDENGNLKVMYHGTSNASFTVFNPQYSDDGISLFFTDKKSVAKGYSGTMDEYIPGKKYTVKELTDIINDSYLYVTEEDGKYHIVRNKYGDLVKEYTADTLEEMQNHVLEEYGSTGAGNYKVYLNLVNPLIVDAKSKNWNGLAEYNSETMDKYDYILVTDMGYGDYVVEWADATNPYGESEVEYGVSLEWIEEKFGEYVKYRVESGNKRELTLDDIVIDKKTLEIIPNNTRQYAYYAKDYGYDSVIIRNVVDTAIYAAGDERFESSTVAIAFSPEQVKSVANTNPTADPDIRYSDRQNESIYDAVGELKRIQRENDKLKADIERLRKKNRLERTVTGGREMNESHIAAVAGRVLKLADSRYNRTDLASELKGIYEYLQGEDVSWDVFMSKATDLAQRVVAEARERKVTDDYAKMILSTIRSARISLNDTQKAEAEYAYGKNWNRSFFGRVTIANDGIPLESVWSEWASMYPDVFDADISDADMVTALLDIYDSTRTASEVVETYDKSEAARELAFEIYNQFWNVAPVRTLADKHDKEVKRLKFEHRQEMKELREKTDKKVFETQWHYSKLIHEVREARDEKIAQLKKESHEYTKQYREKIERRNQISQITKKSLKLNTWLKKNSKDEHIVEELKAPVAAVLRALDFSSERLLGTGVPTQKDVSLKSAFEHLYKSIYDIDKRQGEDDYSIDMPVDYVEFLESMKDQISGIVERVGDNEYVLRDMTLEQLQDMNKMLTVLSHIVTSANKALADANGKAISTMAQSTMLYADSLGEKSKKVGAISNFLNFDNALPVYFFKMMGDGGQQIFRNMQDGWDKMAFHVKQIIDYSKKAYKAEEVKKWSKEVHEFTFSDGSTVKMTTAQIMSLYCLQKREQARQHLVQGGMRIADFKIGMDKITNEDGVLLLPHEIDKVVSALTGRQKKVADGLQLFMNTVCSDWGNEVSMRRFGIKSFGEENYFPIQSDASVVTGGDTPKTDRGSEVFRLLNMDFTKALNAHANNRIVVDNIFDVFATHTSDMAKYNALALPVLDMFRWYNYKESYRINPEDPEDTRMRAKSLKQSLRKAYGDGSTKYIMQFMKDINGAHSGGMSNIEKLGRKMISNYKVAAVGANIRVAILQPTSYVRASAVIDPKYLTAALAHKPQIQKAKDTCGIALWKSLGFYDTNISRGVASLIKHDERWYHKAREISMKLAEWGDAMTWGYLYNACEAEIKATQPGLTGEEKDRAVADRLREVIYATQVVDSTMTRTQNMRNPSTMNQIMTSFMSEPSLSYNLLHDLYIQYNADKRQIGKNAAFRKNGKHIARVTASYLVTLCCASLAGGFIDTIRDDEDEEEFFEKLLSNAAENAVSDALSMLPVIKDAVSIYKGFNVGRMDMQGIQSSYYTVRKLYKAFLEGEWDYKTVYSLINSTAKTASQIGGLPVSNALRDVIAIWNNTIGEVFESAKLK